MGDSANLALYTIVFAKGAVPKPKLDAALQRAVTARKPLEEALVQLGALPAAEVDGLLRIRARLARDCDACGGQTYLLQDQTEENTPCDHCGGRLLTPEQTRAKAAALEAEAARAAAAGAQVVELALAAVEQRLSAHLSEVTARALERCEQRLAAEDLRGFLAEVTERATAAAAAAAREDLAAATKVLDERVADGTRRALEGWSSSQLEQVTRRLEALERRAQAVEARPDPTTGLDERIVAAVTQALAAGTAPLVRRLDALEARANPVDAIEGVVVAAVEAATRPLGERNKKLADRLAALEARPDPVAAVQGAVEGVVLAAVEAATRPLGERNKKLADRLAALEARPDPVAAVQGAVEGVVLAAVEAATRPLVERAGALAERFAGLEARFTQAEEARAGAAEALATRLAALEAAAERGPDGGAGPDLDAWIERAAEAAGEAAAAAQGPLEARLQAVEALARAASSAAELAAAESAAVRAAAEAAAQGPGGALDPAQVDLLVADAADRAQAALDARLDALDARLEALGARPGGGEDGAERAPAGDADALVERALEQVRARLGLDDFPGLPERLAAQVTEQALAALEARGVGPAGAPPRGEAAEAEAVDPGAGVDVEGLTARVTREVLAAVEARLEADLAGLSDRIGAEAARPMMAMIDAKLKALDLKALPATLAADVRARVLEGLDVAALAEQVRGRLGPEAAGGPEAVAPPAELDLERVREVAREAAREALAEQGAAGRPRAEEVGSKSGVFDGKSALVALAREVKALKEQAERGGAGKAAQPDAVALVNTVEFKQAFDAKINQVLAYVKSDLVPSAVTRALREAPQASGG